MSVQPSTRVDEDEIDLRQIVEVVLRHKWFIVGLTLFAVAAAGFISFFVLAPTYVSSVVVSLPRANGQDGLGMTAQGYREVAASRRVIAGVEEALGLDVSFMELRRRYTIGFDPEARLLTVDASAATPGDAYDLAQTWSERFSAESVEYIETQLGERISRASQVLAAAEIDLRRVEEGLQEFDQQHSLSLLTARLSSLERTLVQSETRLRELRLSTPIEQARLAFLNQELSRQSAILGNLSPAVILPDGGSNAGVTFQEMTVLNPVYLSLSRDQVSTETRLATYLEETEALKGQATEMRTQVDELRTQLVAYQLERERLVRDRDEAQSTYRGARAHFDQLQTFEFRLPNMGVSEVIREPTLPEAPVAPRKRLNMALAGFLAVMVGVFAVFIIEWWESSVPSNLAEPAQLPPSKESSLPPAQAG